MSEDKLMKKLGQVQRQEASEAGLDDRLERLAQGRLTEAERQELETLALQNPELARAVEAFRPLGDEFHEQTTERLAETLGFRPEKKRARRSIWFFLPVPAALAAAVLVLFLFMGGEPQPLPAFHFEVTGGVRAFRGLQPPEPLKLVPGSTLQIQLRPAKAVEGEIAVSTLLAREEEVIPLSIPVDQAPSGAVRLRGVVGEDIRFMPGSFNLVVMLARPGEMPESRAWREARAGVQVFDTKVRFERE
jgi:hypothetical protein